MRDTHTYSLLSRLELILCLYPELSGEDATDLGLHLTCPYGVLDNSTCDDFYSLIRSWTEFPEKIFHICNTSDHIILVLRLQSV